VLLLRILIALVWLVNGLYAKILAPAPRRRPPVRVRTSTRIVTVISSVIANRTVVNSGAHLFARSPELWRGKAFETVVHILFIGFRGYLTILFLIAGVR
jgi:hypothetical protein